MAYRNNKWGEYNPQQNENEKKQQLLIQKQKSLHKMKVALDTFYNVLEPLEEYIEKSGNYPGFITKRQIYRKSIQDSEGSLENDEDLFLSDLYIFARTFHGKPEFFMKVIQEDFYKWINAVGITAENTSEELKHFLIEINNVLEGNDEKIVKESVERNKNIEIDPKEMVGMFAGIQNPLNKNRRQRKELEGKKWNEIPEEDRLKGDADLGRQEFERIKGSVSIPHENFRLRYFGEKRSTQQVGSGVREIESSSSPAWGSIQNNSPHPTNLNEVVQEVKNKPQNWVLDEIITEFSNFGERKREHVVYCQHARLDAYYQERGLNKLNFNNNPIYRWEHFNSQQRFEIKVAKNLSSDYLTQDEIKWVVKEVKDNPSIWRIEVLEGYNCLTHTSAQKKDKREIGTLIYQKQKFSDLEWEEINEVLERVRLIDKIKQHINGFEFQTVLTFSGQYWDNVNKKWVNYDKEKQEIMLVHKSVKITENDYNEHGYLNIKTNKMFQENRFSQEEWTEIKSALKVDNIKRNTKLEKGLFVINKETGEVSENEDWYIDNRIKKIFDDKTGYLIYVPDLMIRTKDLTEAEQKEVSYKVETTQQVQGGSSGGKGGWGIITWGSLTVVSLIGLAFTKK